MCQGAVAGPLPDFAVIEFESIAIFWWRNATALDYAPRRRHAPRNLSSKSDHDDRHKRESLKRRWSDSGCGVIDGLSDVDGDEKNTEFEHGSDDSRSSKRSKTSSWKEIGNDNGASSSSPPPAKSWREILDKGLSRYRQCKVEKETQEKAKPTDPFTKISKPDQMGEDDVLLAIATFWEGLRRDGRLFAFAGMDFFSQIDSGNQNFQIKGVGVVGAPQKFIMPLLLHTQKGKGAKAKDQTKEIGHLVLIVATWVAEKQRVRLDLWDSLPPQNKVSRSGVPKSAMIDRAKELIAGSHWPYDQRNQSEPAFYSCVTTMLSPEQECENTCGFYMILNAWCILLGIPISKTPKRRAHVDKYRSFLQEGREIMNLALMGCMDAITVQAFMNVWGYSEKQDPNATVQNVVAARMSIDLLSRALYQQAVVEGKGYKPTQEEILDLINSTGLVDRVSFEEAKARLIEEEGDKDRAAGRLLSPSFVAPPVGALHVPKALSSQMDADALSFSDASLSTESQLQKALAQSLQPPSPPSAAEIGGTAKEKISPEKSKSQRNLSSPKAED